MKHNEDLLQRIALRAHYLANQMIVLANNRADKEKGDPKVGGHSAACSSALHILGALHLVVRSGFDYIANKPHASPADHSYNYLLDLFLHKDYSKLTLEECNQAMHHLRAFSKSGEFVFQSYHSAHDPDHHNFLPSGTVGIPPVNAGYLALAYNYARKHGYEVPPAHFWAIIGDSEFREGSLFEAVPDFAEREIGNLTWIVDYNRQSLDGHRLTNTNAFRGTDAQRIASTMIANGWDVVQVQHGKKRLSAFAKPGGDKFKDIIENQLTDYELQVLLLLKTGQEIRQELLSRHQELKEFLKKFSDQELYEALHDMGGHCFESLISAFNQSKVDQKRPTLIIAHTIKGWGLEMAATSGNHSALPEETEILALKKKTGLAANDNFARFDDSSEEGRYCRRRGEQLYKDISEQQKLKERNIQFFSQFAERLGVMPDTLDINLKMASYPHTQWMLGQLTAKLTRIANTPLEPKDNKSRPLTEQEKSFKLAAEMMVSMAPDVGTSTNLNPAMDGKIFGRDDVEDLETAYGVKDNKTPDLVPGLAEHDRFLRFEIVEANTTSCSGSFGKIRDTLGIPLLPLMTVYDFFIKRAHDQYFYNLYWNSSFILVGTPAGVTLSPEGAQHGWKSDFQIPNQITWEPFFCIELDWILVDAIRRHLTFQNEGRMGVLIRGVTRGVEQKDLLRLLKTQRHFKVGLESSQVLHHKQFALPGAINEAEVTTADDSSILSQLREDVLAGAYYLIDYRGYANYEPGDNVVHIFAMGSIGTEAIRASELLLEQGIYANVIMVTSPDLLVGNLAHANAYSHLLNRLDINDTLHLHPGLNGNSVLAEMVTLAGRRVPIVSAHDGEIGLLDNLGSIVGVRQEALGVRKHSKCGRPTDIYQYHHIDSHSIVTAALKVLDDCAMENVVVTRSLMEQLAQVSDPSSALEPLRDRHR